MATEEREIVGLALNLSSKHVPWSVDLPDGGVVQLTLGPEPTFDLSHHIGALAYNELTDWREHNNWLALVTINHDPERGWSDLKLVVSAVRVLKARWVGLALGWSPDDKSIEGFQLADDVWVENWDFAERYVWDDTAPCELGTSDLEALADIVRQLSDLKSVADEERQRLTLAIKRLNAALDRDSSEDSIVDLTIALEALYINGGEDLKRTLARRASTYLEPPARREAFGNKVRKWYEVRSAIVHGHAAVDADGVEKQLRRVLQRSLRKALEDPLSLSAVRRDES